MREFTIYPAIDLRQGQVVRLWQGDPDKLTVYGDDPLVAAKRWMKAGADWLHVINLDGAFGEDNAQNLAAVQRILRRGARIQFGGGVRSEADIDRLMKLKVSRVIVGTAALSNPGVVQHGVARHGAQRVAVSIDASGDEVRVEGWKKGAGISPMNLARDMHRLGVRIVILTDIQRDGTQEGVDLTLAKKLREEFAMQVIVAGGVASLDDLRQVRKAGLQGAIIGRALYEGQFLLEEALQC